MKSGESNPVKMDGRKSQCHKRQACRIPRKKGLRSSVRLIGKKQEHKSNYKLKVDHNKEYSSKCSSKTLDNEAEEKYNKKMNDLNISFDEESNSLDNINKEIEKLISFVDSSSAVEDTGQEVAPRSNEAETSNNQKKISTVTSKSEKDNSNLNLQSSLVAGKHKDDIILSSQSAIFRNTGRPSQKSEERKTVSAKQKSNGQGVVKNSRSLTVSRKGKQIPCKGDLSKKSKPLHSRNVFILDLPNEILTKILKYLPYLEVGRLRRVCKRFDALGCDILNNAFQRLQQRLLHRFQQIKAKMPRRESARRRHPLARESDIIETLHMRLTLLQMSFGKHIEKKHCCFFAGEILDEILNILTYVKTVPSLGRAYKVTDELFDLTTMAMEYFKEHIEPTLPEINYFSNDFIDMNTPATSSTTRLVATPAELPGPSCSSSQEKSENQLQDQRVNKLKQKLKGCLSDLSTLKKELKVCKGKLTEQQKQFSDLGSKFEQHDKKFEESACQFALLLREYQSCKKELQNWRQSCSCRPAPPSPSRPIISVEEQESPNKPTSCVEYSAASQDVLSPTTQETSHNSKDTPLPVENSISKPDLSEKEFIRTSSGKRKLNRSDNKIAKKMKL